MLCADGHYLTGTTPSLAASRALNPRGDCYQYPTENILQNKRACVSKSRTICICPHNHDAVSYFCGPSKHRTRRGP